MNKTTVFYSVPYYAIIYLKRFKADFSMQLFHGGFYQQHLRADMRRHVEARDNFSSIDLVLDQQQRAVNYAVEWNVFFHKSSKISVQLHQNIYNSLVVCLKIVWFQRFYESFSLFHIVLTANLFKDYKIQFCY